MKVMIEGKEYWRDAKGNLTPAELVKEIDKARDVLVHEWVERGRDLSKAISHFKEGIFGDVQAFIELSAEKYGAKVGGNKGNVTLFSYDGKYKIQRAINESLQFDERIQAAKVLIDECLNEWSEGSRPELKALIERAFNVDKEGNLNTSRILGLRRVEIQDSRWQNAMQAISESVQVVSSKAYVRLYERVGETDQYVPIALDVAGA
jgi:putative sulfate transport protein cysZ